MPPKNMLQRIKGNWLYRHTPWTIRSPIRKTMLRAQQVNRKTAVFRRFAGQLSRSGKALVNSSIDSAASRYSRAFPQLQEPKAPILTPSGKIVLKTSHPNRIRLGVNSTFETSLKNLKFTSGPTAHFPRTTPHPVAGLRAITQVAGGPIFPRSSPVGTNVQLRAGSEYEEMLQARENKRNNEKREKEVREKREADQRFQEEQARRWAERNAQAASARTIKDLSSRATYPFNIESGKFLQSPAGWDITSETSKSTPTKQPVIRRLAPAQSQQPSAPRPAAAPNLAPTPSAASRGGEPARSPTPAAKPEERAKSEEKKEVKQEVARPKPQPIPFMTKRDRAASFFNWSIREITGYNKTNFDIDRTDQRDVSYQLLACWRPLTELNGHFGGVDFVNPSEIANDIVDKMVNMESGELLKYIKQKQSTILSFEQTIRQIQYTAKQRGNLNFGVTKASLMKYLGSFKTLEEKAANVGNFRPPRGF